MASSEATTHSLSPKDRFQASDGKVFELNVLDALYELEDLRETLPEGATHRDYLGVVSRYLEDRHGVLLSPGETDEFLDTLGRLYALKKKERVDAIAKLSK